MSGVMLLSPSMMIRCDSRSASVNGELSSLRCTANAPSYTFMMASPADSTMGFRASASAARSRIEVSYPYAGILRSGLARSRYRVARHGRHAARSALRQLVLADLHPDPLCAGKRHQRSAGDRAPYAEIQSRCPHLAVVLDRLLDAAVATRYSGTEARASGARRIPARRGRFPEEAACKGQAGAADHQFAPDDAGDQERARGPHAVLRCLLFIVSVRCAEGAR